VNKADLWRKKLMQNLGIQEEAIKIILSQQISPEVVSCQREK
jgi:hypothetical protein